LGQPVLDQLRDRQSVTGSWKAFKGCAAVTDVRSDQLILLFRVVVGRRIWDPTPRAIEIAAAASSSGGSSVPFVPSYDSSNDIIRMHWRNNDAAWRRAVMATQYLTAPAAVLFDLPSRSTSSGPAKRPE